MSYIIVGRKKLQSTPSVGRATQISDDLCRENQLFLSTPSVGRATGIVRSGSAIVGISIHALRGEGDLQHRDGAIVLPDISIHALRGEGDRSFFMPKCGIVRFLSTPSVGRATLSFPRLPAGQTQFLSTPSVGRAT